MALDANGQPGTNQDTYNNVDEGNAGTKLRVLRMGDLLLGNLVQHIRIFNFAAAAVSPGSLATLATCVLPDGAKAATLLRATARAGVAAAGELAVQAFGATPATTQAAVTPDGNIATLLADGYTSVDLVYIPERGAIAEIQLPVATNVLSLPASYTANGVVLALEVNALVGTSTGRKIVLVPGAAAPAAGQARLNLAKTTVTFAGADAVTRASVKVLLGMPLAQSLQGILTAAPSLL